MIEEIANQRMDPEAKAKWIEALRSGIYPQTQKILRNDEGFCCLGVACDVFGARWKPARSSDSSYFAVAKGEAQSAIIPTPIRDKIGLGADDEWTLTRINDNGHSFAEIADWIEANL